MINAINQIPQSTTNFVPAEPREWLIWLVQQFIRWDLWLNNRIHISQSDLHSFESLPADAGIILTPNHADETDFKVCVELSRLTGRRFFYLMNREAFDECLGLAGWLLRRLGAFSVERGGDTSGAKRYAIDLLKTYHNVLIVFPEGEIHYLNDQLQDFKTGAVEIGIQAAIEMQESNPRWKSYLMPIAIKYRYREPLGKLMDKRISEIEKRLNRRVRTHNLQMRLFLILAEILHRQEINYKLAQSSASLEKLNERVQSVRRQILAQLEERYPDSSYRPNASILDRIFQLSSYVRSLLKENWPFHADVRKRFIRDLNTLRKLAEMGSWQFPGYVHATASQERLAESIMKLQRDVYGVHRPHQLARRDVFVRIGSGIDLSQYLNEYRQSPRAVRHSLIEQLRQSIQSMLDKI